MALRTREWAPRGTRPKMEVALLTGGRDRPYVYGLVMALLSKGLRLDVVGSDELDGPEMHADTNLNFLSFRNNARTDSIRVRGAFRAFLYYARLIIYTALASPNIFHILWYGKFEYFDRTVLMVYYKLLGKKIVLTLHNINAGK